MNNKFDLNSLKSVKLETIKKSSKTVKVDKTPVNGDIKVFKNGSIFYSEAFHTIIGEKGLDFVNSKNWTMYNKLEGELPQLVFVAMTGLDNQKLSAKVDVRERKPEDSGVVAGVKNNLIPMLVELYDLDPEFKSVELKVQLDYALAATEDDIYYIPKIVTSGAKKGEPMSVRREKVTFYPLTIEVIDPAPVVEEVINLSVEETSTTTDEDTPFNPNA